MNLLEKSEFITHRIGKMISSIVGECSKHCLNIDILNTYHKRLLQNDFAYSTLNNFSDPAFIVEYMNSSLSKLSLPFKFLFLNFKDADLNGLAAKCFRKQFEITNSYLPTDKYVQLDLINNYLKFSHAAKKPLPEGDVKQLYKTAAKRIYDSFKHIDQHYGKEQRALNELRKIMRQGKVLPMDLAGSNESFNAFISIVESQNSPNAKPMAAIPRNFHEFKMRRDDDEMSTFVGRLGAASKLHLSR